MINHCKKYKARFISCPPILSKALYLHNFPGLICKPHIAPLWGSGQLSFIQISQADL